MFVYFVFDIKMTACGAQAVRKNWLKNFTDTQQWEAQSLQDP